MFLFLSKMIFCYRNRKRLNFARPKAASFAVELLPNVRKASDAVKKTGHCGISLVNRAQPLEHPLPRWDCDAVTEGFIPRCVAALRVLFALAINPATDIGPPIRVTLQAFTFKRCKASNDACVAYLPRVGSSSISRVCERIHRVSHRLAISAVLPPALRKGNGCLCKHDVPIGCRQRRRRVSGFSYTKTITGSVLISSCSATLEPCSFIVYRNCINNDFAFHPAPHPTALVVARV